MLPPSSPARRAGASRACRSSAVSRLSARTQRRPDATAVIAVVVARMTSTPTITASLAARGRVPAYGRMVSVATVRSAVVRRRRAEVVVPERVGMQAAAVDLHPEELLEADVAQADLTSEVVEQGELARLVGRLEHHGVHAECLDEPVGHGGVERAVRAKDADARRALARLDHELARARVEPAAAAIDQVVDDAIGERAAVLLAQLELELEAALAGHPSDGRGRDVHIREALAALD